MDNSTGGSDDELYVNEVLNPAKGIGYKKQIPNTKLMKIDCGEAILSYEYFDSSTQFLETGYVGEMPVVAAAWTQSVNNQDEETIQTIPDPKYIPIKEENYTDKRKDSKTEYFNAKNSPRDGDEKQQQEKVHQRRDYK